MLGTETLDLIQLDVGVQALAERRDNLLPQRFRGERDPRRDEKQNDDESGAAADSDPEQTATPVGARFSVGSWHASS